MTIIRINKKKYFFENNKNNYKNSKINKQTNKKQARKTAKKKRIKKQIIKLEVTPTCMVCQSEDTTFGA